jgi:hypothetical protein
MEPHVDVAPDLSSQQVADAIVSGCVERPSTDD